MVGNTPRGMQLKIPFPDRKYQIIYADPPWQYRDKINPGKRGAEFKYPSMSDHEILQLPVSDLADDNCFLFLWATFPRLPLALEVISAWGFTYKTLGFNWVKMNKVQTSTVFWGGGNYTRSNAEVCLLGIKGKPKRIYAGVHSQIITPHSGKHSEKPEVVRDRIIELCGDLPRIELFARQELQSWDCWGNEVHQKNGLEQKS